MTGAEHHSDAPTLAPAGRRLGLLALLYFCQGLPGGFVAVALPVILRQRGASLTLLGGLALLASPWMLKFLWAPLADRYYLPSFGRRRSWLVPAQAALIACTLAFTAVDLATQVALASLLFLLLNVAAATQDIATDGLAVDMLEDRQLPWGNTVQIVGFKLGNITGGGVLLALSDRLTVAQDFAIMAGLLSVALVAVLAMDERRLYRAGHAPVVAEPVLPRLRAAFAALGVPFWLTLFAAKFGEQLGGSMVKPFLVDQGFTRAQIGTVEGILGAVATLLGAGAGGLLAARLGSRRALALGLLGQGTMLGLLAAYAAGGAVTLRGMALLNALENFAGGATGVAVFALAMAACDPRIGAAQFTLCQCAYMSGAFAAAPLAGVLGDAAGYPAVFGTGAGLAASLAVWLLSARSAGLPRATSS